MPPPPLCPCKDYAGAVPELLPIAQQGTGRLRRGPAGSDFWFVRLNSNSRFPSRGRGVSWPMLRGLGDRARGVPPTQRIEVRYRGDTTACVRLCGTASPSLALPRPRVFAQARRNGACWLLRACNLQCRSMLTRVQSTVSVKPRLQRWVGLRWHACQPFKRLLAGQDGKGNQKPEIRADDIHGRVRMMPSLFCSHGVVIFFRGASAGPCLSPLFTLNAWLSTCLHESLHSSPSRLPTGMR